MQQQKKRLNRGYLTPLVLNRLKPETQASIQPPLLLQIPMRSGELQTTPSL
ncbi:expressed unknown protein [Ectocarpus siliculosus]|uniref:Uncharacterized protein n=1 Tax=Ectocarpus siliculosus TaxID=2880 RepID=D7FIT9_ECTSI|nr:expressed unknown protein [Ectocarpus siliculosus]|eukprot:CBJ28906.1 expressed unknown protein [Ectocarpus siliculosus]